MSGEVPLHKAFTFNLCRSKLPDDTMSGCAEDKAEVDYLGRSALLIGDLVLRNLEHGRCRGLVRVFPCPEGLDERRIARGTGEDAYLGLGVICPYEHTTLRGTDVPSDLGWKLLEVRRAARHAARLSPDLAP